MNIMEAARLMEPGKVLVSEMGFTARLEPDNDFLTFSSGDPFAFSIKELLSDKWTVEVEE